MRAKQVLRDSRNSQIIDFSGEGKTRGHPQQVAGGSCIRPRGAKYALGQSKSSVPVLMRIPQHKVPDSYL